MSWKILIRQGLVEMVFCCKIRLRREMNMAMLVHFPGMAVRMMVVNFRRGNIVAVHP